MKKRILIVSEFFYPEEFKVNEIALSWAEKGYEVDVLAQTPTYPLGKVFDNYENKWYSKEIYKGINVYRTKAVTGYRKSLFKKFLKYFTFMCLGTIVSIRIGKRYDYIFGFSQASLTAMVPAVILKKIYNKKVTLWILDIWPDSVYAYGFKKTRFLNFILNHFVKFIYHNSSNFAVSSKGFIERITPYTEHNKQIEYLPNWADEFNKKLVGFQFSEERKVNFTFAGNIGTLQNLDNIIKAFAALPAEYLEKAQLNIIGDGSHAQNLQKLVKKNNFKHIIFWGKKPREEMFMYYRSSDFLLVSLIDKPIFSLTVPAKLQTYIAANKPIVAIISGDTAKIVKDNKLGYTAEPNDICQITKTFIECIDTDKKTLLKFGENCELLTNTSFNKSNIMNSLLKLLID